MTAHQIFSRASVGESKRIGGGFNVGSDFTSVMAFDVETETDFAQEGRLGFYQVWDVDSNAVTDAGLFTFPALSDEERDTIQSYSDGFVERFKLIVSQDRDTAAKEGYPDPVDAQRPFYDWLVQAGSLPVCDVRTFALKMLDHLRSGGCLIGHNVAFDLARVASLAWGHESPKTGQGFCYALCECSGRKITTEMVADVGRRVPQQVARCPEHPFVISRKLGAKKFQYGLSNDQYSGPIIDTVTLGKAVLGPGPATLFKLGLRSHADILKREIGDGDETGHGDALKAEYIDYLIIDVAATSDLFKHLWIKYNEHNLSTPLSLMFSEASVGKAYFAELGITPHMRRRPWFDRDGASNVDPRDAINFAQTAYVGARAEVRLRLTPAACIKMDVASQYPSVQTLMRLQDLWTAASFEIWRGADVASRASDVLSMADHAWLQSPDNWPLMRYIVCVNPHNGIYPARWKEGDGRPFGLVRHDVASRKDGSPSFTRWVTLADAIASKLLTGEASPIVDAIEIRPRGMLDTRPLALFGNKDKVLDLKRDNLFATLIDYRMAVKQEIDELNKDAKINALKIMELKSIEQAVKITCNATAYGVMAETRMEGAREVSGQYYAPWIACQITGGARLILAIAETLARDIGQADLDVAIRHCFADTDSLAFARPDGISTYDFRACIDKVSAYFRALSPYKNQPDLFGIEKQYLDKDGICYFFGVSVKRYALFNLDEQGVKLVGVSSHGLGPYSFDAKLTCAVVAPTSDVAIVHDADGDDDDDDAASIEAMDPGRHKASRRFQAFLWVRAIERALGLRKPDASEVRRHAGFPAEDYNANATRLPVSITTPRKLAQYSALGVKPGSFFQVFPRRAGSKITVASHFAKTEADILNSVCCDVYTGRRLHKNIVSKNITMMRDALANYFVSPERKVGGVDINQKPGWYDVPTRTFDGVSLRNRRGQDVQPDLFDEMENV
jgi:hypothetical protein